MPNSTLRELARRLDLVEQEVVCLRQRLGVSPVTEGKTSGPVDLDTALDRFFEAMGIQGEVSGLPHLRVLQAEQEQVWARRQQNGTAPATPRRKKRRAGWMTDELLPARRPFPAQTLCSGTRD